MNSIALTRGKIVVGALLLSVTLGACASDYGYRRHHDGYGEPPRCHDGHRGNNRGCGRFDAHDNNGW